MLQDNTLKYRKKVLELPFYFFIFLIFSVVKMCRKNKQEINLCVLEVCDKIFSLIKLDYHKNF